MKLISKTAAAALLTATLGATAIVPAYAQQPSPQQKHSSFRDHHGGPRNGGPLGGGELLSFERGAEAIEIALVRLSHRVDLSAEQQPLFEAFRTAALAAATDFEAVTEKLRPAAPADDQAAATPDLAERLTKAIELQKARLAALEAVQPAAVAFFDSLSEEQKANLRPQRPMRDRDDQGGWGMNGPRHPGPSGDPAPAPSGAPAETQTNG